MKADCAKVKIHLKQRIVCAPLLAPHQLWTDILNWCTIQGTGPGRWNKVHEDELSQCGCNCCISTDVVNGFSCMMQSVCWLVWFKFISLLLSPTELLVFTRLGFRCYMDMPTSTLGKMLMWLYIYVLFVLPCPIQTSHITAYCKPLTNSCEIWILLYCRGLY